jgi:fructose-specific phosphotransferase system IIC component
MLNALRLAALMSATIVALLVFELLQTPIGFWPALIVGFVAGILARAAFIWLERVWLRAAARRAHRLEEQRAQQPESKS